MTKDQFLWIPFYQELANKLLSFKNNRKSLLEFIYSLDSKYIRYLHEEDGRPLEDICPFTTIGVFNRGIADSNRIIVAEQFKSFLKIDSAVPIMFEGIPVLNNQKSFFFGFSNKRKSNDIENLWILFEKAQQSNPYDIEEIYNTVIKQYAVKYNITMGLFWINPEKFISLDDNSRQCIKPHIHGIKNNKVPDFENYKNIIDTIEKGIKLGVFNLNNFYELSYHARKGNVDFVDEIKSNGDLFYKGIEVLQNKKQIILQGAPGTGKTHIAKLIAEQLAEKQNIKLIQFHPSYTYEDFVRGIEVKTENGQPDYITRNKVLGEFAELASKNWQDSQKSAEEVSKEEWLTEQFDKFVDFVNEEALLNLDNDYQLTDSVNIIAVEDDAFRYAGKNWKHGSNRMLFKDIKQAYLDDNKTRQDIKKNHNLSGLAQQHASYYIRVLDNFREYIESEKITYSSSHKSKVELENYVLIIDEINRANLPAVLGELIYALEYRGEKVESMYAVNGDNELILPPNLYIIGTMNTADRSVGQIDYAIRRRFAFIDMLPKSLTGEVDGFDEDLFKKVSAFFIDNIEEYITNPNVALKKSEYLSDEFSPEDVWMGHSYFIMKDGNSEMRLNYEIKPILREYLKDGILKENVNGEDTKTAINSL